jgi:SAM-dependent methyltransferase
MIRDEMEKIYSELRPEDIPWNIPSPPHALVELVESGQVRPCRTIELGCGAGNYAIYLASIGFEMTCVDISPSAIALAQAKARQEAVSCRFVAADVLGGLTDIAETFDFAFDWSLLHHIFPDQRERYVQAVHQLLAPGGKYLSVSFSEEDGSFGGTGKYRQTPLGTLLYFSSEDELLELFGPYFDVFTVKTVQVMGKGQSHLMNWVLMKRNWVNDA